MRNSANSSKLRRFQVALAPDIENCALVLVSTSEDFNGFTAMGPYRVCDGRLMRLWHRNGELQVSTWSAPASSGITTLCKGKGLLSFCPASGRLVHLDDADIVICDFISGHVAS